MERLVVVGASAGGVDALQRIVSALPADFPAAVLVTRHIGPRNCALPALLSKTSAMPVRHATDKEVVTAPAILIAPPDLHLTVSANLPLRVALTRGPKENHTRPAIDPLFRSAAELCGPRAIGVLLTGYLDDGTVGLKAIQACGGTVVVQDPSDAYAPDMPANALQQVAPDYVLPLGAIGPALTRLAAEPMGELAPRPVPAWITLENRYVQGEAGMAELERIGSPSTFTCPECNGTLWELKDGHPQRYRCHTGHAFTATVLSELQNGAAEEALWGAVRALQEKERLARSLAAKAAQHGLDSAARDHLRRAEQALQDAQVLRGLLSR